MLAHKPYYSAEPRLQTNTQLCVIDVVVATLKTA